MGIPYRERQCLHWGGTQVQYVHVTLDIYSASGSHSKYDYKYSFLILCSLSNGTQLVSVCSTVIAFNRVNTFVDFCCLVYFSGFCFLLYPGKDAMEKYCLFLLSCFLYSVSGANPRQNMNLFCQLFQNVIIVFGMYFAEMNSTAKHESSFITLSQ